jgi:hypothetical protein
MWGWITHFVKRCLFNGLVCKISCILLYFLDLIKRSTRTTAQRHERQNTGTAIWKCGVRRTVYFATMQLFLVIFIGILVGNPPVLSAPVDVEVR